MSWGYRIAAVYIGFVLFMLGLVGLCMSQKDIFLVEKDYYKEELAYQNKIDRQAQAAHLSEPVRIATQEGCLLVYYPAEALPDSGCLWLFRPSNGDMDRRLPAEADPAGQQTVALADLAPGHWRVKLDWTHAGSAYTAEKEIIVPNRN